MKWGILLVPLGLRTVVHLGQTPPDGGVTGQREEVPVRGAQESGLGGQAAQFVQSMSAETGPFMVALCGIMTGVFPISPGLIQPIQVQ